MILTSRQLQVLSLIGDGHENADIAKMLFLSTETVRTHVAHMLNAKNRAHAVSIGYRLGLLGPRSGT
jgi:DNA-binding CsgD family transcriptional regulator